MSFRISSYPKRAKILSLFFLLSVFSGYANLDNRFSENSALSGVRLFGKQLYMTALWHDGSHRISFFLPKKLRDNKLLWWDTGLLLGGTHFGYRQILTNSWFDQKWFAGIYTGFDVMSDFLSDITKLNLTPFYSYPTRLNLGFELSGARWGQVVLDFYGEPYNPAALPVAKDYFGVSTKISFDHLPFLVFPRVKPFLGAACSWVGLRENEFQHEPFYSFIVGAKYIVNSWLDFEGKYVYDSKGYQKPINFGFQIKFDGIDSHTSYVEYLYSRPPVGYKPHYADSSQLAGLAGNADSPSAWQLAVNGRKTELAEKRDKALQKGYGSLTLDDRTTVEINPEFFSGAPGRADTLSAMMRRPNSSKDFDLTKLRVHNGRTIMDIKGGQSEEELRALINSGDIPVTLLFALRDIDGNGSSIGIYGSTAAFLAGLQITCGEIIDTACEIFFRNFALLDISHIDNQGKQQEMSLLCPVTGVRAEQRAVKEGLLPPTNNISPNSYFLGGGMVEFSGSDSDSGSGSDSDT